MISSLVDYRFYLEADRIAHSKPPRRPRIGEDVWKFQRLLRKVEYYKNCKTTPVGRTCLKVLLLRYHLFSQRLGFTIPPNTFGPGLCIPHRGTIVVHANSIIGENCRIHAGSNIGTELRFGDRAPRIGNNVYIGPGAKIFGDITIGDDIAVAANAVVTHSFEGPHITLAGVPAVKISDKGTEGLLVRATELLWARRAGDQVARRS